MFERVSVSVSVCVYVLERVSVRVSVSVCVYVCEREVFVCVSECVSVSICV